MSDDGYGIGREDLPLVGERYATSKYRGLRDLQNSRSFGFRGEALASIVQVARSVTLTSRHRHSQLTYCKRFEEGRGTDIAPSAIGLTHAGTTITAHNLFHNLPVRRRRITPSVEMERVRSALCKALVVLPLVSLSLHDDQAGKRLLHVPTAASLLIRYHQLFGARTPGVLQTSLNENAVKVSALLSVEAVTGSCLQLIFLGRRYVESQRLHLLVCKLLEPIASQHKTRVSGASATRGSWRPFYVIAIDSDLQSDISLNTVNTAVEQEQRVIRALTSLIRTFLTTNHFISLHSPSQSPPLLPSSNCSVKQNPISTTSSGTLKSQPVAEYSTVLKAAVNPVTRKALYLHPVSGCTHTVASRKLTTPLPTAILTTSTVQRAPSIRASSPLRPSHSTVCQSALLAEWKNPTFSAGDGVS